VIVERLGVAPELLLDSDARLPVSQVLLPLWNLAEELLDDPLVAIHAVENISRETFDIFSYILAASATLGEAANRAIRYFRLITDSGTYQLECDGEDAWWRYRPANATVARCRQDSVFGLAAVVAYIRRWTERDFAPRVVRFPFAELPGNAEVEAFFRAPIELGAEECAFRFDAVELSRPFRSADPRLADFLERYAEDALTALPAVGMLSGRARQVIAMGLSDGETSLKSVAKKLAMSERSLQRQLSAENTSLKDITDELRRELALRYLKRPDLSLAEVAYMLGFSETAPFFRAFKKWTGKTPGDFRRTSTALSDAPIAPVKSEQSLLNA
jgi:AraC-like DNA-binding protein